MLADRGILRQVAFLGVGEGGVYASLYAPGATAAAGVVICPPWGAEVAMAVDASHRLASTLAERGVACVLHHPPGHLDSAGDPRDVTMEDLVAAALDSAGLLRRSCRVVDLRLVGIGIGASVAALAAARIGARSLVLVEPALDPATFFAGLRRSGIRGSLGLGDPEAPFGHAVPRALSGTEDAVRVTRAIAQFPGEVVAFRFGSPTPGPLPAGVQEVRVVGGRAGRRWPHRFVEPVASFQVERAT